MRDTNTSLTNISFTNTSLTNSSFTNTFFTNTSFLIYFFYQYFFDQYFFYTSVGAGIAAGLDLGGTGSESASLELIVTRMRFMGAQRTDNQPRLRILGLSSCVANGTDLGHWLG